MYECNIKAEEYYQEYIIIEGRKSTLLHIILAAISFISWPPNYFEVHAYCDYKKINGNNNNYDNYTQTDTCMSWYMYTISCVAY